MIIALSTYLIFIRTSDPTDPNGTSAGISRQDKAHHPAKPVSNSPVGHAPPARTVDSQLQPPSVDREKASVSITMTLLDAAGTPEPAKNVKLHLLDEEPLTIFSRAGISPLEGRTILETYGVSIAEPIRYREVRRSGKQAIEEHAKYSVTSDSDGIVDIADVKPGKYHIFGATKVEQGYAMWNAQASIGAGANLINLSAQTVRNSTAADQPSAISQRSK
ncbi:MAG: hypothetical protein QUS14_16620 [Pyrinomonadaceae bacterium]|nr:hypothetical protein [Pyrinomonadaceae bacterium]